LLLHSLFAKAVPSTPCNAQHGSAAACCYAQDVFKASTAQLLQLAMNSSEPYTARQAVRYLHLPVCRLQPNQARQLLLTVAANQDAAGMLLQDMLLCRKVQQHIDAATHDAVIERLLGHDSDLQESITRLVSIVVLPNNDLLPAAAQLARDIVARLLLAALRRGMFNSLDFVARMLSDQREVLHKLTSDQLDSLLLAAVEQNSSIACTVCAGLQAQQSSAAQLSASC
jgi:hypothetical protein